MLFRSMKQLLDFWKYHNNFKCDTIDANYLKYVDAQYYKFYNSPTYNKFTCDEPFRLVHKDSKEILGEFHTFLLDIPYKVIDTDKGELFLTDEQLDDLLSGMYTLEFVKYI